VTLNCANFIDVQTIFFYLKVGFFTQICIGVPNVRVFRGDRHQTRSDISVKKFVAIHQKNWLLSLQKVRR